MADKNDSPPRVLVIDHDAACFQHLSQLLSRQGITTSVAAGLDQAHDQFNQQQFDVVIVQMEFKPISGLSLVQKWRNHALAEKRCFGCILSSPKAHGLAETALLQEMGDIQTTIKPYSIHQLTPLLTRAIETRKIRLASFQARERVLSYVTQSNDFEESLSMVRGQINELGHEALELLYFIGERHSRLQDVLPVLKEEATKAKPGLNQLSISNAVAKVLLKLNRYDEAKSYFEKLDSQAPHNIDRITDMASLYLEIKMPKESVIKMKEMITLTPESPDLKIELFAKLYDYGFDEQAQEFCKETTRPIEIVRYYNNKGVLLSRHGEFPQAVKEYQIALRYFPKYRENYKIYFNLAMAHLAPGGNVNLPLAKEYLEKSMELNPDFPKSIRMMEMVQKLLKKSQGTTRNSTPIKNAGVSPAAPLLANSVISAVTIATATSEKKSSSTPQAAKKELSSPLGKSLFGGDSDDLLIYGEKTDWDSLSPSSLLSINDALAVSGGTEKK